MDTTATALTDLQVEAIRKDFPMLSKTMHGKPLIYLDSGATSQKPQAVIDAVGGYYGETCGTVHRAVYELASASTEAYNAVRNKVAAFINAATPDEIIFTRGTTTSINLVAHSFGQKFLQPGDEILVSTVEHHSNIVPWQLACERHGAVLKVIPVDDHGDLLMEEYKALLNEKTKLVAVGHVSNALGTIHPVKEIVRLAHEVDAKVLVDGAQAIPHLPVDVQDLDADFYAFSGHKMCGPTGIGILYGKAALLDALPPYEGGGDMIEKVSFSGTTFQKAPLKFEAGTPSIAQVLGLGAAVDYLETIGMASIAAYEHQLVEEITPVLEDIPNLRIVGTAKNKGAIFGFVVDGCHPLDIGTLLDLKGVAVRTGHHCAQPTMERYGVPATVRASFGLYNTREEAHRFVELLKDVLKHL